MIYWYGIFFAFFDLHKLKCKHVFLIFQAMKSKSLSKQYGNDVRWANEPVAYFSVSGVFIFRNEQTCFVLFSCISCVLSLRHQNERWKMKPVWKYRNVRRNFIIFLFLPKYYKHEYFRRVLLLPDDDVGHVGI